MANPRRNLTRFEGGWRGAGSSEGDWKEGHCSLCKSQMWEGDGEQGDVGSACRV